jgi:hypothetical protein
LHERVAHLLCGFSSSYPCACLSLSFCFWYTRFLQSIGDYVA